MISKRAQHMLSVLSFIKTKENFKTNKPIIGYLNETIQSYGNYFIGENGLVYIVTIMPSTSTLTPTPVYSVCILNPESINSVTFNDNFLTEDLSSIPDLNIDFTDIDVYTEYKKLLVCMSKGLYNGDVPYLDFGITLNGSNYFENIKNIDVSTPGIFKFGASVLTQDPMPMYTYKEFFGFYRDIVSVYLKLEDAIPAGIKIINPPNGIMDVVNTYLNNVMKSKTFISVKDRREKGLRDYNLGEKVFYNGSILISAIDKNTADILDLSAWKKFSYDTVVTELPYNVDESDFDEYADYKNFGEDQYIEPPPDPEDIPLQTTCITSFINAINNLDIDTAKTFIDDSYSSYNEFNLYYVNNKLFPELSSIKIADEDVYIYEDKTIINYRGLTYTFIYNLTEEKCLIKLITSNASIEYYPTLFLGFENDLNLPPDPEDIPLQTTCVTSFINAINNLDIDTAKTFMTDENGYDTFDLEYIKTFFTNIETIKINISNIIIHEDYAEIVYDGKLFVFNLLYDTNKYLINKIREQGYIDYYPKTEIVIDLTKQIDFANNFISFVNNLNIVDLKNLFNPLAQGYDKIDEDFVREIFEDIDNTPILIENVVVNVDNLSITYLNKVYNVLFIEDEGNFLITDLNLASYILYYPNTKQDPVDVTLQTVCITNFINAINSIDAATARNYLDVNGEDYQNFDEEYIKNILFIGIEELSIQIDNNLIVYEDSAVFTYNNNIYKFSFIYSNNNYFISDIVVDIVISYYPKKFLGFEQGEPVIPDPVDVVQQRTCLVGFANAINSLNYTSARSYLDQSSSTLSKITEKYIKETLFPNIDITKIEISSILVYETFGKLYHNNTEFIIELIQNQQKTRYYINKISSVVEYFPKIYDSVVAPVPPPPNELPTQTAFVNNFINSINTDPQDINNIRSFFDPTASSYGNLWIQYVRQHMFINSPSVKITESKIYETYASLLFGQEKIVIEYSNVQGSLKIRKVTRHIPTEVYPTLNWNV